MDARLEQLAGKLIVSCQAREGNPLHGPQFMAAMAQAALQAGAGGIRADGPADIAAIRAVVPLPIIGILKVKQPDGTILITPDFAAAQTIVQAGADIVALSCARYQRPDEDALGRLIARIHKELGVAVMADCATLEEGILASRLGADLVATTLSGYTPDTVHTKTDEPDFALVRALAQAQERPVIAEGRIATPEHAARAMEAGAFAIVVGTAITNPRAIAARFVAALNR